MKTTSSFPYLLVVLLLFAFTNRVVFGQDVDAGFDAMDNSTSVTADIDGGENSSEPPSEVPDTTPTTAPSPEPTFNDGDAPVAFTPEEIIQPVFEAPVTPPPISGGSTMAMGSAVAMLSASVAVLVVV